MPRAEAITEMGHAAAARDGRVTVLNFQPSADGKAAITGDFVLIDKEVNAVARALRQHGIDVTAIHNHGLLDVAAAVLHALLGQRRPDEARPGPESGARSDEQPEVTGSRAQATRVDDLAPALLRAAMAALGASGTTSAARVFAAATEVKLPHETATVRFDFETKGLEGWTTLAGQWGSRRCPARRAEEGAVQRATKNEFNVIVAPPGPTPTSTCR